MEQAGHLQVTAAKGRGEFAVAVKDAGVAREQCSTYWVPWICTEGLLNVDGTAATVANKASFVMENLSAGMILPGKKFRMSPVKILESLPNWTEIKFPENLQAGFVPNRATVVFAKRLEQFARMVAEITGWFIVIFKKVKLSVN
jgi:hypothetical protein